jgi:hypothetical protein
VTALIHQNAIDVYLLVCSRMCLVCVCLPGGCPLCQGVYMGVVAGNPCCPLAVFVSWRTRTVEDLSLLHGVSPSAGMLLSPVCARSCVLRGSASVGFLSDVLVLVVVAFPVCCPGLPSVALWVSWPVLHSVCVWRLSCTPPCLSHQILSVLHIA